MTKITDPELLKKLNASSGYKKVTDPNILAKLNAESTPKSPYPSSGLNDAFLESIGAPSQHELFTKGALGLPGFIDALPHGLKQGLLRSIAGLRGQTSFDSEPSSDIYGSQAGESFGQDIGQGAVAAPFTVLGGLLGGPAGAIAGTGVGYSATEPGDMLDRLVSGGEAAALHGAGHLIPKVDGSFTKVGSLRQAHEDALKLLSEQKSYNQGISGDELNRVDNNSAVFDRLKARLSKMYGASTESGLNTKVHRGHEKIKSLKSEINEIPEELRVSGDLEAPSNQPAVPDLELPTEIDDSHISNHQKVVEAHQNALSDKETEIKAHLMDGFEHGVPIAKAVAEGGKKLRAEGAAFFNEARNKIKDSNIVIPNTSAIKDMRDAVTKQLEESRHHFGDDDEFENTVNSIVDHVSGNMPNEHIPGEDFLSMYRTADQASNKLKMKASQEGLTDAERRELWDRSKKLKAQANHMEQVLKEHSHEDVVDLINKGKKKFREEIFPLEGNTTYRSMVKNVKGGAKDLVEGLRGESPGNQIIKNMIKSDQNLLRHVVGSRYSSNPSALHNFHENTHEYLQHMPDLQQLLTEHRELQDATNKVGYRLSDLKTQHAEAKIQRAEEIKRLKDEQKQRVLSEKERIASEKRDYEQKTKYQKAADQIKDIESKLPQYERAAKIARKAANDARKRKLTSLKDITSLEKQAKALEKQLNEAIAKRKKYIGIAAVLGTGALGTPSLKSMINKI